MGRKLLHDYEAIYKEHLEGRTIRELARLHTIPIANIYHYFVTRKLPYNLSIPRQKEGYYINHNYLDKVDSEDKAYFIGLMLADGTIGEKSIALKLKSQDKYLITKVFAYFTYGYKLSSNTSKGTNCDNNSISIHSKQIIQQLKNYGCIRRKTQNFFPLPILSDELFRHFVRGYFDGDGSISLRKSRKLQVQVYICSIDKSFLESLKKKFLDFNIDTSVFKETRNGKPLKTPSGKILTDCKDMYTLRFSTHESRLRLFELLYDNCTIKLERKYKIFSEYYVNTVLTLEKKGSKAVQRIDNEPLRIDFDNLKTFCFNAWMEKPDYDLLQDLYVNKKYTANKISQVLGQDRNRITKFLKEYNLSTSAQQPIVK